MTPLEVFSFSLRSPFCGVPPLESRREAGSCAPICLASGVGLGAMTPGAVDVFGAIFSGGALLSRAAVGRLFWLAASAVWPGAGAPIAIRTAIHFSILSITRLLARFAQPRAPARLP